MTLWIRHIDENIRTKMPDAQSKTTAATYFKDVKMSSSDKLGKVTQSDQAHATQVIRILALEQLFVSPFFVFRVLPGEPMSPSTHRAV